MNKIQPKQTEGFETSHTFLTDQVAMGTGSVTLNNKITPSLRWNVESLDSIHTDDSGRRARTAKDDRSTVHATAAQNIKRTISLIKRPF